MATQSNVPQSVQHSKLAVVPFPALQCVSQLEIAVLLSLIYRLHQLQEQVESESRLAAGESVEPGDQRAELKGNFRRNVSWKDVVVCLAERLSNGAHE